MYIFASDPHATGQPWIDLVEKARTKYPLAKVVFGGDYIDGRAFAKETLDYVFSVPDAVVLRGNHEQMLIDSVKRGEKGLWLANGGETTLISLFGEDISFKLTANKFRDSYEASKSGLPSPTFGDIMYEFWTKSEEKLTSSGYIEKLNTLPLKYETNNIIFIHAGVRLDGQETDQEFALWSREDYWYIDRQEHDYVFAHNTTGKTIVTGHTPTCMLSGVYEQPFPKANPEGVILGDTATYQCPVKIVKYDGEPARIFTDGGCHARLDGHHGNVVVLDDNGALIDIFS
ncbi:metallophosphoesterase [Ligilactobacillus equi]|uniref:Calcineurin-like phosphoesterase domain-containing protein n=1 Tax=Ligilactobacillus equi DPC 6820 TaxID=1392007 RepID=V7HWU9_9LACO|nr:metallophosphoesterase [Ligilactobacillus equi]ETA73760.1 hypothetical protein LEQ_0063c [Ligilactobacillus equi DPC 6820]